MLQHEPQEQTPQEQTPQEQTPETPAAQIRVTSEELAQAINALGASREEDARRLAGTVPIGEVIRELKLEATPEEIWAQVQRQRAEAAEQGAARIRPAALPVSAAARNKAAGRRRVRGWRELKGWAWVLFWCCGGGGLLTTALHSFHPAPAGAQISGDNQTLTSGTHGKSVEVTGDKDTLTLEGNCPTLTITGDHNHIRVVGTVGRVIADGENNAVTYTAGPAPVIGGDGEGSHVGPSAP